MVAPWKPSLEEPALDKRRNILFSCFRFKTVWEVVCVCVVYINPFKNKGSFNCVLADTKWSLVKGVSLNLTMVLS